MKLAPGAAIASMLGKDEDRKPEAAAAPAEPDPVRLAEGQLAPFDMEAT